MTPTSHLTDQFDAAQGHLDDDRLVDLALGDEPKRAEHGHLRGCAACSAGLRTLERTAATARDSAALELVSPPDQVWAGIEAALDGVVPLRTDLTDRTGRVDPTGRADRQGRTHRAGPPRRRPALGWLAAACAAGVFLGAGGLVVADRLQGTDTEPVRTLATAQLDTLDTKQRLGTASVSEGAGGVTLEVSARDLTAGGDGYVEVWLINRDLKRLVSVGVLGEGAQTGTFPISQRLLDEGYVVVDISREQFDDKPQHSGDSIVRGSLTTSA